MRTSCVEPDAPRLGARALEELERWCRLPEPEADELSRFELTASLTLGEAGLRGFLRYSTDLFNADTVATIARGLEGLFAEIAIDPRRALSLLTSDLDL